MIGETPRNKLGETPNEAFEKSPHHTEVGDFPPEVHRTKTPVPDHVQATQAIESEDWQEAASAIRAHLYGRLAADGRGVTETDSELLAFISILGAKAASR